jgi:hypothetical protein
MGKPKPKGICDGCGKSPRALTQIESGQWVCVTCLREIRGPQRPKNLATPEQIIALRKQGFDVSDDLPKAEYRRLAAMITLQGLGIPFNSSASLEELEELECRNYVNHRSVNVAGVSHNNPDGTNRQQIILRCSTGELLRLKEEDDNPFDPNAVAVIRLNGEQIGYLHREDAAELRKGSQEGWLYAAIINKILKDSVKGHCLGVGLTLVYARSTADPTIIKKHIANLIRKHKEAH